MATEEGDSRRASKRLLKNAAPKESIDCLRHIREGQSIVVRRKPEAGDSFAWATATALSVAVTDNETNVTVRFQPLPDDSRAAKNSGLILTDSVSTKNGAKIATLRHSAATSACNFLPATNVLGEPVEFQVRESNIYRNENQGGAEYIRYDGASPEEYAAQNRIQPLLDGFSLHGSVSCEFGQVCPSLDQLMLLVDPESEQRLHLVTPTKEFIRDVAHIFTRHVPGQNKGVDIEELVSPFVDSTEWTVMAMVLGPSMPVCTDDFDKITAVAILLVNREGVVLVPFTATNRARQREGVAHQFRNFFLLVRNFFRGSTNTPVITHVVAQSHCDYGYFAFRRNHEKMSANDLRTVISGDATFDTYANKLSSTQGIYIFASRDYISEVERPMPVIPHNDQKSIVTRRMNASNYVVTGHIRSSLAAGPSRTAGSSMHGGGGRLSMTSKAAGALAQKAGTLAQAADTDPESGAKRKATTQPGTPPPCARQRQLDTSPPFIADGDGRKTADSARSGLSQRHSAGMVSLEQIEGKHGVTGLTKRGLPHEYAKIDEYYLALDEQPGPVFLAIPHGQHNMSFGSSILIHCLTRNANLTITIGREDSVPLTYAKSVDHGGVFTIENESENTTAIITVMKTCAVEAPAAVSSGQYRQPSSSHDLRVESAAAQSHSAVDSIAALKQKVKIEICTRYIDLVDGESTEKNAFNTILDALDRQCHEAHARMNVMIMACASASKTVSETIDGLIKMAK